MGTNGTSLFCGLISGLAFSVICVAGGQTESVAQTTQNAYYQPLTQEQYQQHAQTAFDESAAAKSRPLKPSRAQDFEIPFNSRLSTPTRDRISPEARQRASRLLKRQQLVEQTANNQFGPQPISSAKPTASVVRYRKSQNDPFGAQQIQDPKNQARDEIEIPLLEGSEPFEPVANRFQQDQTTKQDPFGEDQVPKPDKEPPKEKIEDKPPAIDPQTDPLQVPEKLPEPKNEPVAQEPKKDPVLPDDAQFIPNPTEQPKLTDPNQAQPVVPLTDVTPEDIEPADPARQPQTRRRRRTAGTAIEYHQGKPLQEKHGRAPVYYEQPSVMMPPIVQPGQLAPYQSQPYVLPPQPALINPPIYQPDYQPIPGIAPEPVFVPSGEAPMPPGCFIPNMTSPPVEFAQAMDPQSTNQVYSGVVAEQCATNCGPCANACPNFYFSVFGGFSDLRDMEGASGLRQIGSENGGGVGVALGRRNGRNLRTEAEFSYRHHSLDSFVVSPAPGAANMPVGGDLNSFAGMANAYWEIIDVPTRCFKPYVGVGIGFVGINAEIRDSLQRNIVPSGLETDSSFAYQWIGGVNYKAYRNVDLFAEYRYFSADAYRIDPAVPGLGDRYTFKTDNVFFGFRWKF